MSEKSQFLQKFEKLNPKEQEEVAKSAILIAELLVKKGIKK